MGHRQVNSCVNDSAQVLTELPRSWSPAADIGNVVYVVDDEDDFSCDVRLDSLEDVGDAEDVVISMMM